MLPPYALALLLPIAAAASVDSCAEPVTKTIYSTTNIPFPVSVAESTEPTTVSTSIPPVEEPTLTKTPETPLPTTTSTSSSSSSSSSTTSSTSTTSSDYPQVTVPPLPQPFNFERTYLAAHNRFRALFQDTPPLVWNKDLESIAQKLADNYKCNSNLVHSQSTYHNKPLGENLAYGFDFERAAAVTAWFNEITDYDWSKPGFSHATGHFTQLVWADTTDVGCGYKNCENSNGYYIVCEYAPAGNWVYENDPSMTPFVENVKEPINPNTKKGFNIDTLL